MSVAWATDTDKIGRVRPTHRSGTSMTVRGPRCGCQKRGWRDCGRGQATVAYRTPTDVPLVGRLVGDLNLRAEATTRVEAE